MINFKADEKFENTLISQLTVKEFRGLMESIFAADRLAAEQRKLASEQGGVSLRGGRQLGNGSAY